MATIERSAATSTDDLGKVRTRVSQFISRCRTDGIGYRLTPAAEATPYARCFGVFCRHLVGDSWAPDERRALASAIRDDVRLARAAVAGKPVDKPFRQLLAFALSALAALDALDDDPLADVVTEQLPATVAAELDAYGCLAGRPGSGNQAMFSAVFLLHARDRLGIATGERIDEWVAAHLRHMNRFGFWGQDRAMTHLHFQNGYHQYEIFEYLGIRSPREREAIAAVRGLADPAGHFAPNPGGGGCYDYDAVYMLTPRGAVPDAATREILEKTRAVVLDEQGEDGGFAETVRVRPRTLRNIAAAATHTFAAIGSPRLFVERLRYNAALQRPKHNRIVTHWSRYARGWSESDLWDSWFRLLTLARIDVALDPARRSRWGFIDYPGIGYHPGVAARTRSA